MSRHTWLSRPRTAVLILALAIGVLFSLTGRADEPPRVVMISIDGLKPEAYTKPGTDLPALRKLAADGAHASGVVGVFPTVTYPSHTTLMTGVTPAVHGVYNNRILDPEDRSNSAWDRYAREIAAPTLTGAVRARGLVAASVNWPVSVDLNADPLFPEYFRSPHPETLLLLKALSRPSTLIDDVEFDRGKPLSFPMSDEDRTSIATFILKVHRPHLLLLHIFDTDTAQHESGPGTPEARAAIEAADRNVARILASLDTAGTRGRTNVVVVSDHGFLPVRQQLQLNTLFKQEGWLTTDARGRVATWQVYAQSSGGSAFVFLKNPQDAALRDRVAALLRRVAADASNGVDKVMTQADLTRLGADPRASFAVSMRSGFYTANGTDALLTPTSSKGGHGFDPDQPELYASFLAAGPNVPRVGDLGVIRMTQIAPTIAGWLGTSLSPKADSGIVFGK